MNIELNEFGVEGLSGSVILKPLTNGQRIKFFRQAGLDLMNMSSEINSEEGAKKILDFVHLNMDEMSEYCQSVDLKYEGEKIEDFDSIAFRRALMPVQIMICTSILVGSNKILAKKKKNSRTK